MPTDLKNFIIMGTESEYLIHEEILSPDGDILESPATFETLANLICCIPSESLLIPSNHINLDLAYNTFIPISNGGRLYIDMPFLEYATPECPSVKDVVLHEEVGNSIVNDAANKYFKKTGKRLSIYKMIPDREVDEDIPGYHENYGIRKEHYFNLFTQNIEPKDAVLRILIPFLVTRQIFIGAGAEFTENTGIPVRLSQRAKWIEKDFSNNTATRHKPIIHLKPPNMDETLLRVHITCGDPNREQYRTFLKIGTTAVVLTCLGQNTLQNIDIELLNPVKAFQEISAQGLTNIKLKNIRLKNGAQFSALDIQTCLLNEIKKKQNTIKKPEFLEWDEIVNEWGTKLQKLSQRVT